MDFTYFMQRSIVAAPGISEEARGWYEKLFRTLFEGPEWVKYRDDNSLSGAFLSGAALMNYLASGTREAQALEDGDRDDESRRSAKTLRT